MNEDACKYCGGDHAVAEIAVRMGHRPDIAFCRVRRLEALVEKLDEYIVFIGESTAGLEITHGGCSDEVYERGEKFRAEIKVLRE